MRAKAPKAKPANIRNGLKRYHLLHKSVRLFSAALTSFFGGAPIRCRKLLFVFGANRLAVVRIEIVVDFFDQTQFFLCRQIQKPVKNQCNIFFHNVFQTNAFAP